MTTQPQFFTLISNLFQQNPKRRHSGMDRRNLGSMDGKDLGHPCNLGSGDPCRNDGIAEIIFLISIFQAQHVLHIKQSTFLAVQP